MLSQFQLNCIGAQDDCQICFTEATGLSVHLTTHEQFNRNQVINFASYSPPGNFTNKSNTDFFLLIIVEIFKIILKFKKFFQLPSSHEPRKFQIVKMFLKRK